jgi:hypothetical protein
MIYQTTEKISAHTTIFITFSSEYCIPWEYHNITDMTK